MIYISSALKQQEIIDLLEKLESTITYKFVEKKGIKLSFEVSGGESKTAVDTAKAAIKATDFGKVLYFQVTA
ncbi:MAG: hypothetical protein R3Y24_02990 [Eubacteriales bacterium]